MNRPIWKYLLGVLFTAAAVYTLVEGGYLALFKKVGAGDMFVAVVLSFGLSVATGMAVAHIVRQQYQTRMRWMDVITLPMMMNLWGFLIPVRGGMIYSIFFLKSKYNLRIAHGTSVTLFLYMISFILVGIGGLAFCAAHQTLVSTMGLISLTCLVSPLLLPLAKGIVRRLPVSSNPFLVSAHRLANTILDHSSSPWKNPRTVFMVSLLWIGRYLMRALRFYWGTVVFGLHIPFASLFLLSMLIEVSEGLFRFSPGNLGVSELLSGGLIGLMGENTQEGILIALFSRLSNLILTFTWGLWAVMKNIHYLHIKNFKSLWEQLKTTKS